VTSGTLADVLGRSVVETPVFDLRRDDATVLLAAEGLPGGPSDDQSDAWTDDTGVTCRRWDWRQCTRTRLTAGTTRARLIIDALGPDAPATALAAADDLERRLRALRPAVATARRTLISFNA
jgi:DNA/RNA-binding domain of Phe-tRNA-synthetase-like protein